MLSELINTLYQYNAWANSRILDTTALLSPEQFLASRGASYASVRDTLVHTLSGQWIYLARWKGSSPHAMWDAQLFPDLASLRPRWDEIEGETRAFVAELNDAQLARIVAYTNTEDERWAYPLWQQMLHQVNHATQHRSEVAVMLTQFGCSPGWLDFLYFIDVRNESG
jgi:uncharacterized damage-inducible protein DinB